MITRMQIVDFQSIDDLDVRCGPITVFYGESDTGKSAIVRALYALAFNSYPTGHVRQGGGDHSWVTVELDSAAMVAGFKGSGKNAYMLNVDGEETRWAKVGSEVPVEVTDHLGWRVLELDDGTKLSPNFQLQFDPPFLLMDPPSKRAKVLGSLTNVATLYAAVKEAGAWERKSKSRVDAHQEIVDRSAGQVEALAEPLTLSRKRLDDLSRTLAAARVAHANGENLTVHMMRVVKLQETHAAAIAIMEMMDASLPEGLEEAERLIPKLGGLDALYQNLKLYEGKVRSSEIDLTTHDAEVARLEQAVVEFEKEHEVCPLCGHKLEVAHAH